jgi:hypothetical protein
MSVFQDELSGIASGRRCSSKSDTSHHHTLIAVSADELSPIVIHAAGKRFTVFNSRQSYARSASALNPRALELGGLVFLTGTNNKRFRACPK